MAQLLELQIQGIRSIGPDSSDAHIIRFLHPVTIISGPNGSGKTTLIEALNYVTTDAKPSGQLHSFIHSLEVCGLQRVDALVKLKFKSSTGNIVTAAKRMNVSRAPRGGKIQSKSDEFSLVICDADGNVIKSLTAKVADTKTEILNLLNVPRAILSNVIFCHQENSCWPLGEPKVVKERFDAIFELTKYVKAVEKLKKTRKDMSNNLLLVNKDVNHYEEYLFDKKKKENELSEFHSRLTKTETDIQRYEEKALKAKEIGKQAEHLMEKLKIRKHDIKMAEFEYKHAKDNLDMINCEDYPGSEQDLQNEIAELENSREFRSIEERKTNLRSKLSEAENQKRELSMQKENLEEQKIQLRTHIEKRKDVQDQIVLIESSLRTDYDIVPSQSVMDHINDLGEKKTEELDATKHDVRTEVDSSEKAKDDIVKQVQELDFKRKANRQSRIANNAEIARLKKALADVSNGQKELNDLQRRIARLENEKSTKGDGHLMALEHIGRKREKMQKELDSVRISYREAEHLEESEKERSRKTNEKIHCETKLDELLGKHENDFALVWGGNMPPLPLGSRVRQMSEVAKTALNKAESVCKELEMKLQSARMADSQRNEEEKSLRKEIQSVRAEMSEISHGFNENELESGLSNARETLKNTRRELAPIDAKSILYESWSQETTQRQCCPLCERRFASKAGAKDLANKLSALQDGLPSEVERLTSLVSELELKERNMERAIDKGEQLSKLEDRLKSLETGKQSSKSLVMDLEAKLKETLSKKETVIIQANATNRILSNVSLMDSLKETIDRFSAELSELSTTQSKHVPSFTELKLKKEQLESEIQSLLSESDSLQKTVNESNRISEELNRLQSRRLELGESAANVSNVQLQIDAKEKENEELVMLGVQMDDELPDLRERESEAIENRKQTERKGLERIENIKADINELEKHHRDLSKLYARLEELDNTPDDSVRVNEECADIENEIQQCCRRIEDLNSQIRNTEGVNSRRQLLENQLNRMKVKSVLLRELSKLEKMKNEPWESENEEELMAKLNKCRNVIQKASEKIGESNGTKNEITNNITKLNDDLQDPKFLNLERRLREKMVQKLILEHTSEDLKSYGKKLEETLLDFHKTKMEAVNEILENLWRKVYKGNDIESIRIRSEMTGTGDKTKYDYKVVMVLEGGTEMEMRDRCSAGQKMLAAILIRIALSDVFGGQCSILALDEPTTNLDVQKIDDMADMLIELINARRADEEDPEDAKQFQLIIITHDERFVSKIQQAVRPEYVYHVFKTEDGKSRLEREKIHGSTGDRDDAH